MKRCSECAREIEESATVCDACAAWAATHLSASADDAVPTSAADPPTAAASTTRPPRREINRRQLLIAVAVVVPAALVGFALFIPRSNASSNVSAAAAVPAARPPSAPAARPPSAPAARQPSAPASSTPIVLHKWSADNRAYWVGNQRHAAAFELQADNLVQTWFGPVRPALVVRCTAKTIQTFVYTGSPMKIEPHAEGKTVTVSVDDEPVRTERWPDSDNHDALFAPDGAAFAQRLRGAHTLRFGYSPHNANDVVAQFHVSGLAELIEPVAKDCGWTK